MSVWHFTVIPELFLRCKCKMWRLSETPVLKCNTDPLFQSSADNQRKNMTSALHILVKLTYVSYSQHLHLAVLFQRLKKLLKCDFNRKLLVYFVPYKNNQCSYGRRFCWLTSELQGVFLRNRERIFLWDLWYVFRSFGKSCVFVPWARCGIKV